MLLTISVLIITGAAFLPADGPAADASQTQTASITSNAPAPQTLPPIQAKADRATAYYYYGKAHMYAEKAAAMGGLTPSQVEANRREFVSLAIENYKAAIKADPQMQLLTKELADVEEGRLYRFIPLFYR